jgi:hypothetical protein
MMEERIIRRVATEIYRLLHRDDCGWDEAQKKVKNSNNQSVTATEYGNTRWEEACIHWIGAKA